MFVIFVAVSSLINSIYMKQDVLLYMEAMVSAVVWANFLFLTKYAILQLFVYLLKMFFSQASTWKMLSTNQLNCLVHHSLEKSGQIQFNLWLIS